MKKIICLAAALLLLALALTGCHKHVSAAPATCTEPEICTECGKVMTEALGHDPGPEATCAGSHGRGGRRVHYLRTAGGSGRTAVHRTR